MSVHGIGRKVPAHAARLLAPGERVRYLTRPRLLSLHMFVFIAAVVFGVVVFSVMIEDPGFMRLLSIPAFPLLGGIVAYLLHWPVTFVTDRRVVSARRFVKPLSLDLENLEKMLVQQTRLGRLLGYATLHLLFPHPRDRSEGVFLNYSLEQLPDAASLAAAISVAAGALRK